MAFVGFTLSFWLSPRRLLSQIKGLVGITRYMQSVLDRDKKILSYFSGSDLDLQAKFKNPDFCLATPKNFLP